MRIKNWKKFQHFSHRRPPWIRLYRTLLDDKDWHSLSGDLVKFLVNLWLLASEDETKEGILPDRATISFRLRKSENEVNAYLSALCNWLTQDATDLHTTCIQDEYKTVTGQVQSVASDTDSDTETDTEIHSVRSAKRKRTAYPPEFEKLWQLFPGSTGSKKDAYAEYKKADIEADEMAAAIMQQIEFKEQQKRAGEFVAEWGHFFRWIKKERWNDKMVRQSSQQPKQQFREFRSPDADREQQKKLDDEKYAKAQKAMEELGCIPNRYNGEAKE
jgi:hypothetical protein